MNLLQIERDARDSNTLLLGVSHVGHDKLTGSIYSCAVGLDYKNITPEVVEQTLSGSFTKDLFDKLQKAVKVINMYELNSIQVNTMADTNIATHWADYHALYGCVFEVFHKFSADPDVVVSELPIKEVIKNPDLSLYTTGKEKSQYVIMSDWNQFKNLIPNAKFYVEPVEKSFTLMCAKAFAQTRYMAEIKVQQAKYPGYTFGMTELTETDKVFLKEHGLTEYHHAYLPVFSDFAFKKHILI